MCCFGYLVFLWAQIILGHLGGGAEVVVRRGEMVTWRFGIYPWLSDHWFYAFVWEPVALRVRVLGYYDRVPQVSRVL